MARSGLTGARPGRRHGHPANSSPGYCQEILAPKLPPTSATIGKPSEGRQAQLPRREEDGMGTVKGAGPRTCIRSFRASPDQVREARRFLAEVLGDCPTAPDALACLS